MYSGSAARSRCAQRLGVGRGPRLAHHVGDERRSPARTSVAPARPHRGTPGQRAQRGLDLAELDAEPADLHLLVDAAEVLDAAVGAEAREVAGAVQARAGLGGERDRGTNRSAVSSGRRR